MIRCTGVVMSKNCFTYYFVSCTYTDVDEETDIYLPIIGENSTVLPQVERSVSSPSASTEKPPLDDDYVVSDIYMYSYCSSVQ